MKFISTPFQTAFFTLWISVSITLPVFAGPQKSKPAPVLNMRDIAGKQVNSKTLLSKGPVLVWFWNSCCGIKKPQVESLKKLYEKYKKKGFQIVAISEDGVNKTGKTKKAVSVYKMPFIIVMDKSRNLMGKFQAFAVPSVYLISRDNKIVFTHSGYMPGDEKKLEKAIVPLFPSIEAESKTEGDS